MAVMRIQAEGHAQMQRTVASLADRLRNQPVRPEVHVQNTVNQTQRIENTNHYHQQAHVAIVNAPTSNVAIHNQLMQQFNVHAPRVVQVAAQFGTGIREAFERHMGAQKRNAEGQEQLAVVAGSPPPPPPESMGEAFKSYA